MKKPGQETFQQFIANTKLLLKNAKEVEEVRNSFKPLIADTKLPIELQNICGDNISKITSLEMRDNYLIVSTVTLPIPQLEEISIPANFNSKQANEKVF